MDIIGAILCYRLYNKILYFLKKLLIFRFAYVIIDMEVIYMDHYYYINYLNISKNSFFSQPPECLSFAYKKITPECRNSVHFHAHLEIFYYTDGNGYFEIDNHKTYISKGDLVVVNSNNNHIQYPIKDNHLTFFVIAIDKIALSGLPINSLTLDNANFIHFEDNNNNILPLLFQIQEELDKKSLDYFSKVNSLLQQLLIDIRRALPKPHPNTIELSSTPSTIYKIKDYIDTHFMDDLTLDSLIKRSYMAKSYFFKQFKKYLKVSPMKYIMELRLQHAQLLLIKTELSISEIALSLQFSNFSYFSEIFKQHFGESPSDFRIRNQMEIRSVSK